MESVTFKGWVARDGIDDRFYPRTFLFARKPDKREVYYYTEDFSCEWKDSYGKLGSYDLKKLLPDLKFKDGPVEVEITVKVL